MLVDDPVKRVDNMTMAAAGSAGAVPRPRFVELAATCPPEFKLGLRRKRCAQGYGTSVAALGDHRPHQGILPGARHTHLEGDVLARVRDALTTRAARRRGFYRRRVRAALLRDPNDQLTALRGNTLWQLAVLEMWLQTHGIA